MELTPIKVKGKGGGVQKKTWRPPAPQRAAKRPRDEGEGRDDAGDDRPRRRRFRSKRPAAPVEELPTEILETIILMSQNLNFLRSSLRIGYRFSSPCFLTELLEAAFEPTWQMWLGYHRDRTTLAHDIGSKQLTEPHAVPGDPAFQSAVLACRWANTALILKAQQKWCRRNGGPGWLEAGLGRYDAPASARPLASRGQFERDTDVAARFEQDWEAFNESCADLGSRDERSFSLEPEEEPDYLEVHPSTKVPERLLTGPSDWEAARTLFWLGRGGARLARENMSSWELTKRGYDHIVKLKDKQLAVVLVALLGKLRAFDHWPMFLLDQELENVEQQKHFDTSASEKRLSWYACTILRTYRVKQMRETL